MKNNIEKEGGAIVEIKRFMDLKMTNDNNK